MFFERLRSLPLNAALTLLWLAIVPARPLRAAEIRLVAASDLNFVLKELLPQFEHQTGDRVKLSLGSSGSFYAQIRNGAPFDLFLSADSSHARELEKAGIAESGSTFVYAYGQLALWVLKDSPLDIAKPGLGFLAEPEVRRVAIATPKHAPYGRAAMAALEHFGVVGHVRGKLVLGESVLQAAQFVQTGGADVGIIALSLALSPAMLEAGRLRQVPADSYPKIEQAGVVLRGARARGAQAAAQALADWIRGPRGRTLLERYGFMLPAQPASPGRAPR